MWLLAPLQRLLVSGRKKPLNLLLGPERTPPGIDPGPDRDTAHLDGVPDLVLQRGNLLKAEVGGGGQVSKAASTERTLWRLGDTLDNHIRKLLGSSLRAGDT